MKRNQYGFGLLPIIVAIAIIAVILLVFIKVVQDSSSSSCRNDESGVERHCTGLIFENKTDTMQRYTFKELGVGMSILPGWIVDLSTTESTVGPSAGPTSYIWTVKNNSEGKVILTSIEYGSSRIMPCTPEEFIPALVKSVNNMRNPKLLYVTYNYEKDGIPTDVPVVMTINETSFFSDAQGNMPVTTKDLTLGNYYVCSKGFTLPGVNLELGNFPKSPFGKWRQTIGAEKIESKMHDWRPLQTDSPSSNDINKMIMSIE